MELCLDIGNTRTKAGLFEAGQLVGQAIWEGAALERLTAFTAGKSVKRAIFSSVAQPETALLHWLNAQFDLLELTHHMPLPFHLAYRTPATLGKDRLAAVAGAQALYPGRDCIVVDAGTCIKYEKLTAAGSYVGGNIAPGLAMRLRAMHDYTARLPEVSMEMPENPVGESTETALQNGGLRGAVLEIEGFVRLFRENAPDARVILSGGDAPFLTPFLSFQNLEIQPDLVLIGLNHLLRFNTHS